MFQIQKESNMEADSTLKRIVAMAINSSPFVKYDSIYSGHTDVSVIIDRRARSHDDTNRMLSKTLSQQMVSLIHVYFFLPHLHYSFNFRQ